MSQVYKFHCKFAVTAADTKQVVPITVQESSVFIEEFVNAMNRGSIPLLMNIKTTQEEKQKIYANISKLDCRFTHGNYFIMCTSGTTGYTKLVVHSYNNILKTGQQFANVLNACANDVFFSAAKMFHAYGLGNSFSIPQAAGASVVYCNELITPKLACDVIERHSVTVFCAVPRHYASMVATNTYPKNGSLRICVSAGEKLPAHIKQQFEQNTGVRIIDAVGSTEMLGFMLADGRPVPGVNLILDEQELLVRSDSMFLGYYNEPSHCVKNNWMRTGDLYEIQNRCYVHQGRTGDLIKINGNKIYTGTLEQEIMSISGVQECAVTVFKTSAGLEKLKLQLVCDNYKEIRHKILTIGQKYRTSFVTEIKNELPRTATGKIRKYTTVYTS